MKAGDRLARAIITLGGIGTIAAVLMVAVFLLSVALPLFRPARIMAERSFPIAGPSRTAASQDAAGAATVSCMGADETGSVAWLLDAGPGSAAVVPAAEEGTTGRVRLYAIADGGLLQDRPAADCGLAGVSAIRVLPAGMHAIAGFADGTFRVGRLGLESTYLADGDLPAGLDGIAPGSARPHGDDVIVRAAGGQHATVRLIADLSAPPSPHRFASAVLDVDITMLSSGPVVAALDAGGRVRVETTSSRRNLLTDEVVTTATGSTIDVAAAGDGFAPRFVRVSELGDELFLIAESGAARRYDIRDVETPVLREDFTATQAGTRATGAVHVFGGSALAVADAAGVVRVFFATRSPEATTADGLRMVGAKVFAAVEGRGPPAPVTALVASPRSRLLAIADAAGGIRLVQTTTGATVVSLSGVAADGLERPATGLLLAPRENRLLAVDGRRLATWAFTAGYPQVSWRSLFGRVWYEKYPGTVHAWETTGHEAFESKFGLVPLIFGTLKATVYSMLFAVPIAILAAIYASQFMHPRWKARIKPTIEMMASLPSVVLGFIAGLVLAPIVERFLMPFMSAVFCVPLALLCCAHLWLLLPAGWRSRFASWRFPLIATVALPAGCLAARAAAAPIERLLFQGDVTAWLDGRGGSGFGGWVVALLPLAAVAAAAAVGRFVHPWLRRTSGGWSQQQAAVASLVAFVTGVVLAVALAVAAAAFLDALRLDTRGGVFGTYVQRNSLVVAIGMSFAIIPLIFTIAEDALSAVPDHLRSASLGAGATPWQTAVRVIVPAATSGLFSAVMIGLGRAVGETMIVLMAAGNTPLMEWNVFNGFQTLSAAIATELPEAARGSAHYRVLFLAALTLFAMTFVVNTAAELVRQRFRRRAHEL